MTRQKPVYVTSVIVLLTQLSSDRSTHKLSRTGLYLQLKFISEVALTVDNFMTAISQVDFFLQRMV